MSDRKINFSKISRQLLSDVVADVQQGSSVILLGPPYGGKTLFMSQLQRALGDPKLIVFGFQTESPCVTESEVRAVISAAVARVVQPFPQQSVGDNLTGALRLAFDAGGKRLVLLGSSIDGMALHLARRFLTELNELCKAGMAAAVLTGEFGLLDLISGEAAVFHEARLCMLQGFEKAEFLEIAAVYIDRANRLGLQVDPTIGDSLWEVTGGNDSLLASMFWVLLEGALSEAPSDRSAVINADRVFRLADEIAARGIRGAPSFIRADWLISNEPSCWPDLERLLHLEPVTVPKGSAPGPLELSGLAVRSGSTLSPASRIVTSFLAHHYTDRHLADLAGRAGNWNEAFRRYELAGQTGLRPADPIDRRETAANLVAFGCYLQTLAPNMGELLRQFTNGCRYLLGLNEVTLWERLEGAPWELHSFYSFPANAGTQGLLRKLLPKDDIAAHEYVLPGEFSACGVAWVLEGERDERKGLIVVSDCLNEKLPLSSERREFGRQLLKAFHRAHSKALELEKLRSRIVVQQKYSEIVHALLALVHKNLLAEPDLLAISAHGLRELRYKRVLFCMVNAERTHIRGVLDDCDDTSIRVDRKTDWRLQAPTRDLQPWVVANQKWVRIRDATREPMANQEVVRLAGMKALAIVPIIVKVSDTQEEAIGTIHVERADGLMPSRAEVEDLELFGRELGIVLQLGERIRMVESGIEKLREPLLIVDAELRPRFCNALASSLLNIPTGYHTRSSLPNLPPQAPLHRHLAAASTGARRLVRWSENDKSTPIYNAIFEQVADMRDGDVGAQGANRPAVAQFRESRLDPALLNPLEALIGATTLDDALIAVLDCGAQLGRSWGRIWKISDSDPSRFVSFRCFSPPNDPVIRRFEKGGIQLAPRTTLGTETWQSVEQKRVLVFKYDLDGIHGHERVALSGLPIISVVTPCCPEELAKKPRDIWVDVPLLRPDGEPAGKMTLEWSETLPLEDLDYLRLVQKLVPTLRFWK